MTTATEEATMTATTDGMGFTEREWETLWNSETATSTVHRAADDDETYCEGCDSPVTYDGPADKYGTCRCES